MLDISLSGVIWTVVNLLVLYAALRKILFKPVTEIIESRQKEIEEDLASAAARKAQAEAEKAACDAKLAHAGQEAAKLAAQTRARGEREYAAILAKAQADAQKLTGRAREEIEAEREEMLRGARREVASLALLAAAKAAGESAGTERERAIVDAFLAEAGDEDG